MTNSALAHALTGAIERLYEEFANYRLRPNTEPCLHCNTVEDEAALHACRLRELSGKTLSDYAGSAMRTWGEEIDFKHFLPRIFEIVSTGTEGYWPDVEIIFATLKHANWKHWPATEREAITDYLMLQWRVTLEMPVLSMSRYAYSGFPAAHHAEDLLCAIGQAVDTLRPFLEVWFDAPGENPLLHLAEFLENNANHLMGPTFATAYWEDHVEHQKEIQRWLLDDALLKWLEQGFFNASSEEVAEKLSTTVAILESIRT